MARLLGELEALTATERAGAVTTEKVDAAYALALLVASLATDHPAAIPAGLDAGELLRTAATANRGINAGMHAWLIGVQLDWLQGEERWSELIETGWQVIDDASVDGAQRAHLCARLALAARSSGELAEAQGFIDLGTSLLDGVEAPPQVTRISLALQQMILLRTEGLPDEAAELWAAAMTAAEQLAKDALSADSEARSWLLDAAQVLIGQLLEERANQRLASQFHEQLDHEIARDLQRPEVAAHPDCAASLRLIHGSSLLIRGSNDPVALARAIDRFDQVISDSAALPGDRRAAQLRRAEAAIADGDLAHAARLLEELRASSGSLQRTDLVTRAMLEMRVARMSAEDDADLAAALSAGRDRFEWFLAELAGDPIRSGGRGYLHFGPHRGLLGELIALELAVHGPATGAEHAVQIVHRIQAAGSRARTAGYRWADLDRVRELLLPPGQGLLIYLPAIGGSHLIALDADRAVHFPLARVSELNDARRAFAAAFDPLSARDAWSEEADALADQLIPPGLHELLEEWNAVSVVGLDLLRYVPIELLPAGAGGVVGDLAAVSYLPSIPIGVLLAQRSRTRPLDHDLVLLAAPEFANPSLEPIPFDERARSALTSGAGPEATTVLSGAGATRAALRSSPLTTARLLVLVTHGELDRTRDLPVGLCLAGTRSDTGALDVLWAQDFALLGTVPPTVIAAACRSARSAGRLGEGGLDSLAGALFDAGAQCVFLAHEDLEYAALLDLIEVLQPLLLDGEHSSAQALQIAQARLRERRPDTPAAALLHAFGLAHRRP